MNAVREMLQKFFILHSSCYFVIWWYGFTFYTYLAQLVVLVLLLIRVYHSFAVIIFSFAWVMIPGSVMLTISSQVPVPVARCIVQMF